MGQAPRNLVPTGSSLGYFGAEVRRLRNRLGLSQADLGRLVVQSKDLVRKVEAGDRVPSQDFVDRATLPSPLMAR